MEIIARIENGFREKFGVPRQSGLVPEVISRVVMAEKYSVREAFRGIEDYSHLWLLWEFDRAQQDDWRPTVRPPRLGGNTRLGVFATRSPFRPNRIGLTVVRLIRMEEENGRITLVVSGADLMDGTPIVDIKPYLPYVDSVPDAVGGFTEQTERHRLTVDFPEKLKKYVPKQNLPAVMGLLAQDPRPAYQLVPEVISRVVMAEKYSVREAFRGIEDYSHLWLLWEFDRAQQDDWRPTVRPPRLGGNTRLGVFATRSPFRPNRIGLTVVRLIRMEEENGRITLVVSGADLMDGTPIVDIKPYLPYVDSVPDAVGGFTEQTERHRLTVDFPEKLKKYVPKQNLPAVMGLLAQDPRPAYQHDGKRVYGVPYGEVDIRFVVEGDTLTVVEVVPYTEKEQKK